MVAESLSSLEKVINLNQMEAGDDGKRNGWNVVQEPQLCNVSQNQDNKSKIQGILMKFK